MDEVWNFDDVPDGWDPINSALSVGNAPILFLD
jgi:hypothetical protein